MQLTKLTLFITKIGYRISIATSSYTNKIARIRRKNKKGDDKVAPFNK